MAFPVCGRVPVGRRPAHNLIAGWQAILRPRLLWPAVMTVAMVALTLALGVWQVRRLEWKTALLAEIDRGEAAEPVALAPVPRPFSRVRVTGDLLPGQALYGTEVRGTRTGIAMGAQAIQPLQLADGRIVLIDRGWVPEDTAQLPVGPVTITAYVRPPEYPVRFGAADNPATRRFYALDPVAIGSALGIASPAPFTLVALGPDRPGEVPAPATVLPRPVNNHLAYAVTWFAFAVCALAVFAVYARQALRPRETA